MTAAHRVIDFHTHPCRPGDLAPGTREFVARISRAIHTHGDALADPEYFAAVLRADGERR